MLAAIVAPVGMAKAQVSQAFTAAVSARDTVEIARLIRAADPVLGRLIGEQRLLIHPLVIGEIALGNLPNWDRVLAWLRSLPAIRPATDDALYQMVSECGLQGSGLGVVDAHLLAAVAGGPDLKLWTRDKRLAKAATGMNRLWREPA